MLYRLVEYCNSLENLHGNKHLVQDFNRRIKRFFTTIVAWGICILEHSQVKNSTFQTKRFSSVFRQFCATTAFKNVGLPQIERKINFFSKNYFPLSFVHFAPVGPKRWLNLSSHISPTVVRLVPSEQAKIAQNLNFRPENTELTGGKKGLIWSVRFGPRYGAPGTKWMKLNRKSISKEKMKLSLHLREANHFEDSGSEKSLI